MDTPAELRRTGAVNAGSPVNSTPFATTAFDRLRILRENHTIAMVGLSSNPFRPSHFAAIYMLAEDYDVIPVNPRYAGQTILGQRVYASLEEIPAERAIGIVDVFRSTGREPVRVEFFADEVEGIRAFSPFTLT